VIHPESRDLNAVLRDMHALLQRTVSPGVELVLLPDERPRWVTADASQLEQVVLNLAVNARDAMPGGGTLLIETGEDASGDVVLRVTDDGTGMEPEVRSRLFEPFFTTKEHGTGLGLATVRTIVEQLDGSVQVDSVEGRGTVFTVRVPSGHPVADTRQDVPAAPELAGTGEGTVLLVDDERSVRRFTRRVLERLGFEVLEAENGEEALQIFAGAASRIDLLVTDLVMPLMGGRELTGEVLRARPELPVLTISGYIDDNEARLGICKSGSVFLQKPFTPAELAAAVHEARGRRRAAGPHDEPARRVSAGS